jgi:hypothetical protein
MPSTQRMRRHAHNSVTKNCPPVGRRLLLPVARTIAGFDTAHVLTAGDPSVPWTMGSPVALPWLRRCARTCDRASQCTAF